MNIRRNLNPFFFFSLLFLMSCSASGNKVLIGNKNEALNLSYVALLPTEGPVGVRAERVERTREMVQNELKNKGVLLVEDRIVDRVCSSPACPEWKTFFDKYHVDAVSSLNLDTVSGGDFYLGRYSTISGTIDFRRTDGQLFYKTEHTTRQAGGLLLNTGAVVQAVKTLSDSFQDSTFDPLAAKFARDLLNEVEFGKNDAVRASSEKLSIGDVSVKEVSAIRSKLCVQGTPSNLMSISSRSLVSDLVEVSPGSYCAVYPSRNIPMIEQYSAQLRSPSGLSVTKQLSMPVQQGKRM